MQCAADLRPASCLVHNLCCQQLLYISLNGARVGDGPIPSKEVNVDFMKPDRHMRQQR